MTRISDLERLLCAEYAYDFDNSKLAPHNNHDFREDRQEKGSALGVRSIMEGRNRTQISN